MKTGWQQVNGSWYYMDTSGKMAVNTWIGDWYVDGSGAWTKTKQTGQMDQIGEIAGGIVMVTAVTRPMAGR